jgi:heme-degrading monooxygenase HmoA
MFVVIFEVQPRKERWDVYLNLAKQLKPKLEATEGFIDNERFASKQTEGRVLSLSTWRDEKSVVRWRSHGEHHGVQEKGRFEVFEDYHLRVGEVTADTDPPNGVAIAQMRFDVTEVGQAKVATITEVVPAEHGGLGARPDLLPAHLGLRDGADGLVSTEVFESIYNPGKLVLLAGWRDADAAAAWTPAKKPDAARSVRHRHVRIIRDYGMSDRKEAPQFYPDVRARAGAAQPIRRTAAG